MRKTLIRVFLSLSLMLFICSDFLLLNAGASIQNIKVTNDNLLMDFRDRDSWIPLWHNTGPYDVWVSRPNTTIFPEEDIQRNSWQKYEPYKPYDTWKDQNPSYTFNDADLDQLSRTVRNIVSLGAVARRFNGNVEHVLDLERELEITQEDYDTKLDLPRMMYVPDVAYWSGGYAEHAGTHVLVYTSKFPEAEFNNLPENLQAGSTLRPNFRAQAYALVKD